MAWDGENPSLGDVTAAYTDQRGRAHGASTVRLRWLEWRWQRACDRLDQAGLARLKAVRDELRDRREWAK